MSSLRLLPPAGPAVRSTEETLRVMLAGPALLDASKLALALLELQPGTDAAALALIRAAIALTLEAP